MAGDSPKLSSEYGGDMDFDTQLGTSCEQYFSQKIEFKLSKNGDSHLEQLRSIYQPLNKVVSLTADTENMKETETTKSAWTDGIPEPKVVLFDPAKVELKWKQPRSIGAALANVGNTCFFNSVIQCLTYTPPIVSYFHSGDHAEKCRIQGFCALCEFRHHCLSALNASSSVIQPKLVHRLKAIGKNFRLGRQEDAHEFLRYFVDALQQSCLKLHSSPEKLDAFSKATTVIHQIFGGFHRSRVVCLECKKVSDTYDPLLDISLDINMCSTLIKALQYSTKADRLDGNNRYACPHCKKMTVAHKMFTVHRPPNVLTIHLKRFDFSRGLGVKLGISIDYGEYLDIRPYTSDKSGPPLWYRLYAVVEHLGFSVHSGHYICYVRNSNGIWYCMNDAKVSQTSINNVLRKEAYLLFYIRDYDYIPLTKGGSPITKPSTVTMQGAKVKDDSNFLGTPFKPPGLGTPFKPPGLGNPFRPPGLAAPSTKPKLIRPTGLVSPTPSLLQPRTIVLHKAKLDKPHNQRLQSCDNSPLTIKDGHSQPEGSGGCGAVMSHPRIQIGQEVSMASQGLTGGNAAMVTADAERKDVTTTSSGSLSATATTSSGSLSATATTSSGYLSTTTTTSSGSTTTTTSSGSTTTTTSSGSTTTTTSSGSLSSTTSSGSLSSTTSSGSLSSTTTTSSGSLSSTTTVSNKATSRGPSHIVSDALVHGTRHESLDNLIATGTICERPLLDRPRCCDFYTPTKSGKIAMVPPQVAMVSPQPQVSAKPVARVLPNPKPLPPDTSDLPRPATEDSSDSSSEGQGEMEAAAAHLNNVATLHSNTLETAAKCTLTPYGPALPKDYNSSVTVGSQSPRKDSISISPRKDSLSISPRKDSISISPRKDSLFISQKKLKKRKKKLRSKRSHSDEEHSDKGYVTQRNESCGGAARKKHSLLQLQDVSSNGHHKLQPSGTEDEEWILKEGHCCSKPDHSKKQIKRLERSPKHISPGSEGKVKHKSKQRHPENDRVVPSEGQEENGRDVPTKGEEKDGRDIQKVKVPVVEWDSSLGSRPKKQEVAKWDGCHKSDVVEKLTAHSYSKLGSAVKSWDGEENSIDSCLSDRHSRKRARDDWDEEMDKGKTKKVKTGHLKDETWENNKNVFQEFQNKKTTHSSRSKSPFHLRHHHKHIHRH